ncbi:MAG: hypothetical protein GWN01_09250 [Nitrosopumilaceae archaeon]|nr:hypothetical protein [Nitrosopumilaceae archaeon]NIU87795.1 hypothetical protein [Nitrosopumilaceae archaeon]NIV65178.1 hypothetical protein [Nitrosopumilaceae archaeon]NIX61693.1 hypothetical protein [Nitrosopumilaceae archaeon]
MSGGLGRMRDIGAALKTVLGVSPQNNAGSAINGPAIDRTGFESCVLSAMAGSTTGSPTSFTVDAKLQESADGSTGWADISGAAISALTAVDTEGDVDIDLSGVKKFVRAVVTPAFVGGTSPTVDVAATVVLGGAQEVPAA